MQICMAALRTCWIDEWARCLQAKGMHRRQVLGLLPGGASLFCSSCAPRGRAHEASVVTGSGPDSAPIDRPVSRPPIRAICFDLFTLFDPRGVVAAAKALLPAGAVELCEAWRVRQFEYSWIRCAAGQYRDFRQVTDDALGYAARSQGLQLSSEVRRALVEAYSELSPWPDTREQLTGFRAAGLKLATLANYSPDMIAKLLEHAGLTAFFDERISTDQARTFKPDPRAYALGPARLKLSRSEIAFSAFGSWDAAGAKWFGYPTFWVNRLDVVADELATPDGTGATLRELASFVAGW
jgi:2-haloacid dehalogenase